MEIDRIIQLAIASYNERRNLLIQTPLTPFSPDSNAVASSSNSAHFSIDQLLGNIVSRLIVDGPVPPDSVFIKALGGKYDIVIALYHDQGHIPGKFLGWKWDEALQRYTEMKGVTIVLGLPIIRTNPDHGTSLEIAGEGIANFDAMVDAIKLAAQIHMGRKSVLPEY